MTIKQETVAPHKPADPAEFMEQAVRDEVAGKVLDIIRLRAVIMAQSAEIERMKKLLEKP